jgi:hypothetical protein
VPIPLLLLFGFEKLAREAATPGINDAKDLFDGIEEHQVISLAAVIFETRSQGAM